MHSIFWFRTRQWVLSRVLHLTEHKKQTLLAAPDAVLLLPALFRKRRISRILLVTTPGFVRRGTLTSLLDGCKKENISVHHFLRNAPDPQTRAWTGFPSLSADSGAGYPRHRRADPFSMQQS